MFGQKKQTTNHEKNRLLTSSLSLWLCFSVAVSVASDTRLGGEPVSPGCFGGSGGSVGPVHGQDQLGWGWHDRSHSIVSLCPVGSNEWTSGGFG